MCVQHVCPCIHIHIIYKSKWEPFLVHDYDQSILFQDETIWNVKLRGTKLNTQNGLKCQRYEMLHLVVVSIFAAKKKYLFTQNLMIFNSSECYIVCLFSDTREEQKKVVS